MQQWGSVLRTLIVIVWVYCPKLILELKYHCNDVVDQTIKTCWFGGCCPYELTNVVVLVMREWYILMSFTLCLLRFYLFFCTCSLLSLYNTSSNNVYPRWSSLTSDLRASRTIKQINLYCLQLGYLLIKQVW